LIVGHRHPHQLDQWFIQIHKYPEMLGVTPGVTADGNRPALPQPWPLVRNNPVGKPQEKSRANSGARLFVRTTNLNLTEPFRSFCPGFNLAEGPVVIALRSQLVPIIGATAF
jgi:hypothetical protein